MNPNSDENLNWHGEKMIEAAAEALKKNNFTVHLAAGSAEAVEKLLSLIEIKDRVACGGSPTIKQIGIREALKKRGQITAGSRPFKTPAESLESRRNSLLADVFMASPNAVTLDGKLMFLESIGNRTGGMAFGPGRVIAVLGFNKIVSSVESGWERIRFHSAPVNAKRLNLSTPCAKTGICADCSSEQRICNIEMVLRKKPKHTKYDIILINEDLGY